MKDWKEEILIVVDYTEVISASIINLGLWKEKFIPDYKS